MVAATLINNTVERPDRPSTPHRCALHESIASGCKSIVDRLLHKNCCDLNERDPNFAGDTPLHVAVRQLCQSTEIWGGVVGKMLEKGAYIGMRNDEGNTPVHLAFFSDNNEVTDALLKIYASTLEVCRPESSANEDGLSVFHVACTRGDLDVLKALARCGLDEEVEKVSLTSKAGFAGYTSLHFAVASGQREVVKLLLAGGANMYATDKKGSTPLHLALQRRDEEMIGLLLPYYRFHRDMVDGFGYSHFMAACTSLEATYAEGYLQASALKNPATPTISVDTRVQNIAELPFAGYSPLHFAVVGGNHEVIDVLLKHGADVHARDANGSTPIHLAMYRGDQRMIELMFSGVDMLDDAVDDFGVSHLMAACASNQPSLVRKILRDAATQQQSSQQPLIDARVRDDVNVFAGYTALHFAVESGNHEIVELLLDRDADIYLQNAEGSTALHLALLRGDARMIDLILLYDGMTENVVNDTGLSHFMAACAGSEPSVVKEYLRVADLRLWTSPSTLINGSTTDHRYAGYSPLHFAAEFHRLGTVQLLLNNDADCCSLTDRKLTPLLLAQKHEDVSRLLKQRCQAYRWLGDALLTQVYFDVTSDKSVSGDECEMEKRMVDFNCNRMDCEIYEELC